VHLQPPRKITLFAILAYPLKGHPAMTAMPPSMSDRDGKIWMDGQMVDWRDAKIHVLSHTLHYGCGAFEGVRAYNTAKGTAIFRLAEHTERLFNSAKILRMNIPFTKEQVQEAQIAVVRENKLESCYLRPLTWIGIRNWACLRRAIRSI
jgi:branched-chain amino acid aminotransferase